MNPQNKLWIEALTGPKYKDDVELINIHQDKCYHFLSQFVSLASIKRLNAYLRLHAATSENPVLTHMQAKILDDMSLINRHLTKQKVHWIMSKAVIDGHPGYYFLRLKDEWHNIIGFRVIFNFFGLEYTRFHLNDYETESPGFKSKKELIHQWKRNFFDKAQIGWELSK